MLDRKYKDEPSAAPRESPQCLSWNIHSHRTTMKRSDYYVAVDRLSERHSWYWVIQRRSSAMGVDIKDGPFRTRRIAVEAGRAALGQFLQLLAAQIQSEIGGWATQSRTASPCIRSTSSMIV
jgi:hypothetical protein